MTLAVFSGRPDPQWEVFPSSIRYKKIQQLLDAARRQGHVYNPDDIPSRLGYKGFLIDEPIGMKQRSELILGPETTELQLQLLHTLPVDEFELEKVQQFIEEVSQEITQVAKTKGKPSTSSRIKRYAYPYEPNRWNVPFTIANNNCYNYANNKATNTYAQPGRGSGDMLTAFVPASVRNSAVNDGLENLDTDPLPAQPVPKPPNGKKHLVALVVHPLGKWKALCLEMSTTILKS